MKTYKFKKEITKDEIEAIMHSAFQGMNYWGEVIDLKENCEVDMPYDEAITNGFSLKILEKSEDLIQGKRHTLTLKKFLKGLAMMSHYDYYDYDAYDCEQVIQYALFGEIRYS